MDHWWLLITIVGYSCTVSVAVVEISCGPLVVGDKAVDHWWLLTKIVGQSCTVSVVVVENSCGPLVVVDKNRGPVVHCICSCGLEQLWTTCGW